MFADKIEKYYYDGDNNKKQNIERPREEAKATRRLKSKCKTNKPIN